MSLATEDSRAIDTAWRVHQAQVDWTGRVDTKAAFAFTIESAAIATAVALTAKERLFSSLEGFWSTVLYLGGLGLLLTAAGLSSIVVIPRLRRSSVNIEAHDNFIYFGHARCWEPDDLAAALHDQPILPQIARQIVVMSRIAWTKHVRVQWSFSLALLGSTFLVACGFLQMT